MATPNVYRNTIILSVTWSVSSYTFYFCEYYLRLIPTNTLYLQKALMGIADIFATLVFYLLMTYLGPVKAYTILFSALAIGGAGLCTLIAYNDTAPGAELPTWLTALLSISLLFLRISSFASSAINMSQVIELTPTMLQGLVFGVVNTVSRGITIFSPVVAELVNNGSWTCCIMACFGIVAA